MDKHSKTSWTQNSVAENTEMKEQMKSIEMEKEELASECISLNDASAAKGQGENERKQGEMEQMEEEYGTVATEAVAAEEDVSGGLVESAKSRENSNEMFDVGHKHQEAVLVESFYSKEQAGDGMLPEPPHDDAGAKADGKEDEIAKIDVVDKQENVDESKEEIHDSGEVESKASFVRRLVEENESLKKSLSLVSVENEELAREYAILAEGMRCKANEVELLEENIMELEDYVETMKNGEHEEEESLRKKLQLMSIENEELAQECATLAEGMKCKANEVMMLEAHIKKLEDYIDEMKWGKVQEEDFGIEANEKGRIIPQEIYEKMEECSGRAEVEKRYRSVNLMKKVLKEDVIAEEDEDEDGNDDDSNGECDNTSDEGSFTEEDTLTEEDILEGIVDDGDNSITEEKAVAGEDKKLEEEVCTPEEANTQEEVHNQDKANNEEGTFLADDVTSKEHFVQEMFVATQEDGTSDSNFIESETTETRNEDESGAVCEGDRARCDKKTNVPNEQDVMNLLGHIWDLLNEGQKEEKDGISPLDNDFVENPWKAVKGLIMKIKEENRDLFAEKSEMKELVEFLEFELKFTNEDLAETKNANVELEKEKKVMEHKCQELEEKCQNLENKYQNTSKVCQGFKDKFQNFVDMFQNLEEKCLRSEKEVSTLEKKCQSLEGEKAKLGMKAEEVIGLQDKVEYWSEMCGKLYLFLKRDNAELEKVEERCRIIGKRAKGERSLRKKVEVKNCKLQREGKMMKRKLDGRRRILNALGGKNLDLQIQINCLQSEMNQLIADKDGFEQSYKSELGLNICLSRKVEGLQSRIRLFEESLEGNRNEIRKVMSEKKITLEELERVREVKRENKRIAEELMKEREVMETELKEKNEELFKVMKLSEETELRLIASKEEMRKIGRQLEIESHKSKCLEMGLDEELKIRAVQEKKLKEIFAELREAKEELNVATEKNSELENAISTLQEKLVEGRRPKQSRFKRWFRRRRSDG